MVNIPRSPTRVSPLRLFWWSFLSEWLLTRYQRNIARANEQYAQFQALQTRIKDAARAEIAEVDRKIAEGKP